MVGAGTAPKGLGWLLHNAADSSIARIFGGPFVQHEVEEQFALIAAEMMRRKAQ
jgi:hypothetical protein